MGTSRNHPLNTVQEEEEKEEEEGGCVKHSTEISVPVHQHLGSVSECEEDIKCENNDLAQGKSPCTILEISTLSKTVPFGVP